MEPIMKTLIVITVLTMSSVASAKINGLFQTAQVSTPTIAVSLGSQEGVSELEARIKAKGIAENYAWSMTSFNSANRNDYPFSEILKSVNDTCKNSEKLQLEGEKITYDLYTSLVDGNSYVRGVLTFKYKCPEMSHI
jgi:hypothetical protein